MPPPALGMTSVVLGVIAVALLPADPGHSAERVRRYHRQHRRDCVAHRFAGRSALVAGGAGGVVAGFDDQCRHRPRTGGLPARPKCAPPLAAGAGPPHRPAARPAGMTEQTRIWAIWPASVKIVDETGRGREVVNSGRRLPRGGNADHIDSCRDPAPSQDHPPTRGGWAERWAIAGAFHRPARRSRLCRPGAPAWPDGDGRLPARRPHHQDAEDAFQATFLVLVRKAASIASRELLANWLYGVAHQTALKARASTANARRKKNK